VIATTFVAVGCDRTAAEKAQPKVTTEDLKRDAGQAVNTSVSYAQQTKEEFQASLTQRLKEYDAEITALKSQGATLKDDAKVRWDQTMDELAVKRDDLHSKLSDFGRASERAGKEARDGIVAAWDNFEKAIHDATK